MKLHGHREIVLHFTNEDVTWKKSYKLEKKRQEGQKLWRTCSRNCAAPMAENGRRNIRKEDDHSVIIKLAVTGHENLRQGEGSSMAKEHHCLL